ncbi:MAG: hypothetical protein AAFQ89_05830 [Cyanobacteria bacterium J06626_18]
MKALVVSSLTMMAIASGTDALTSSTATHDDRAAQFEHSEVVTASQYRTQNRQYGGGGTGRREILSNHLSHLVSV